MINIKSLIIKIQKKKNCNLWTNTYPHISYMHIPYLTRMYAYKNMYTYHDHPIPILYMCDVYFYMHH